MHSKNNNISTVGLPMEVLVTKQNFNERGYLAMNPDVAAAVQRGHCKSGRRALRYAFAAIKEGRRQRHLTWRGLRGGKERKSSARVRPLLRNDMPHVLTIKGCPDFSDARNSATGFAIVDYRRRLQPWI